MAKKIFLFMILFAAATIFSYSQADINNVQFEESDVKIEKPPYFGLGGGYVGNFIFLNLDDINTLAGSDGLSELKSPIYLSGAEGFTAIGLVPNLRIGFSGYSGFKKTEKAQNFNTIGIKYEVGFTGFAVDYGIVLFKSFAILPGLNFGWSNIKIDKYTIGKFSWNDLKQNAYTANVVNGSFWFVQPKLNIEFAATPFLMVRLGCGYPVAFGSKWKLGEVADIGDVPSGIKTQGFLLNFGLFVGLFNY
jgi:hypothetical protein